jgi:hypothetical protein
MIGAVTNNDPLRQKAAESYWLGNPAMFRVKPQHFDLLLKYFSEQGEIPEDTLSSYERIHLKPLYLSTRSKYY